ncbi:hypothetical protein [Nesterenkonia alba]|uniref:hypothetical protein n=1 Tax=Nesterenkonia alba TaxID=515814 RepID=UPI0003B61B76|nr:hypothetical protein [Nesterenkonia alba]
MPRVAETTEPTVLLVTGDPQIRDDLALIAAVVGARLEVRQNWHDAGTSLGAASSAVLCTPEMPPPSVRVPAEVLMVGTDDDALFRAASQCPATVPVPLPRAERWLSEHLSARVLERSAGRVLGLVGALGGVGVTTFAYLLSAEAAVLGHRPMLIDADFRPGSGASHLVEQARAAGTLAGGGLTLPQLLGAEGEISSSHLHTAAPVVDGVHVLTGAGVPPAEDGDSTKTSGGAGAVAGLGAVLRAAARAFDPVVVDLSRGDAAAPLAEHLDTVLVVTRPSLRGADAAAQLLQRTSGGDTAVVLNGRASPGWGVAEMEEALGARVVADLAEQRWLARSDDPAEAYEMLRTTRGTRLVHSLLEHLGVHHG